MDRYVQGTRDPSATLQLMFYAFPCFSRIHYLIQWFFHVYEHANNNTALGMAYFHNLIYSCYLNFIDEYGMTLTTKKRNR